MMRINRWITVLSIVVALTLVAVSTTGTVGAASITMKISHAGPTEDARHKGALTIEEVVEAETNGEVDVQVYPSSQLGNENETVEGMQFGVIEMVILPTAFMGGFQPLVNMLDLFYFLPEDVDDLLELYETDAIREVLATTEEVGIKTLDLWHTGYKQPSANKPLRTPEDYDGVKFREMPSPVLIGQLESIGATPINMPFTETYSAMQTGAVDGQPGNPINLIYDMKFHEVQNYVMMANVGTLDQLIMVSEVWWDGLPADVQAAIRKGVEAGAQTALEVTEQEAASKAEAIRNTDGVEIVTLTAAQREELREAFTSAWDVYVELNGERGQALLDKVQAAIVEVQSD